MGMMMNYMMAMGSFDQKKFSTKTNVLAGRPVLGDSAKASRGPSHVVLWPVLWKWNGPLTLTRHHRLV
jgi:hypothetical protein